MNKSVITRMPDLKRLEIPTKQKRLAVKDEIIFRDLLNEKRTMADRTDGAKKGDYCLVEVIDALENRRTLHVEVGKKKYPGLDEALFGCRAGDEVCAVLYGTENRIRVISVRRTVEYPLTDESIEALGLPNIRSLSEYRVRYIEEHGEEIAGRMFRILHEKLQKNLVSLSEMSLDPEDVDHYHNEQRTMIQNLTGDVDKRLTDVYGPKGGRTAEECDRMFFEDNRLVFANYLWSKTLAEQNGVIPNKEETQASIENYCLMFDTTEAKIREENRIDDALRSFYFQYGTKKLKEAYFTAVEFTADGIPAQPCRI